MSPLFDDLEAQLAEAARARVRRRGRRPAWLLRSGARVVPALAAAAVVAAVAIGALALLGHARRPPASPSAAPQTPGTLIASIPPRRLRREIGYMTAAGRPVLASSACRPQTFPRTTLIHHSPGRRLISILSPLRRPASRADRLGRQYLDNVGEPVDIGWTRLARVVDGTAVYLVPVREDPSAGQPSARCFALQRAALRKYAPRIPAYLRRQTIELQAVMIGYDLALIRGAPRDALCLVTIAGHGSSSGCGLTAAQLAASGSGLSGEQSTFTELVPDGVASVTLSFPAHAGRAAFSATARVVDNVFAVRLPPALASYGPGGEPVTVWRAADGRVLKTITPPSAAKLRGYCLKHPVPCMSLTGTSTSGGAASGSGGTSYAASSSSAAAAPSKP